MFFKHTCVITFLSLAATQVYHNMRPDAARLEFMDPLQAKAAYLFEGQIMGDESIKVLCTSGGRRGGWYLCFILGSCHQLR